MPITLSRPSPVLMPMRPEDILAKIAVDHPGGWKFERIMQVQCRLGAWHEVHVLKELRHLPDIHNQGFEKVNLLLTHANGGEARPDYYLEELCEVFRWQPFDQLTVNVNQGQREAVVLAVVGDEALIEYEMPKGSTALWVIHAGVPAVSYLRNISYKSCPKKWLVAMQEVGAEWIGRGQ